MYTEYSGRSNQQRIALHRVTIPIIYLLSSFDGTNYWSYTIARRWQGRKRHGGTAIGEKRDASLERNEDVFRRRSPIILITFFRHVCEPGYANYHGCKTLALYLRSGVQSSAMGNGFLMHDAARRPSARFLWLSLPVAARVEEDPS